MSFTWKRSSVDTKGLDSMVKKILRKFHKPYPEDITDQVFLIIQEDHNYLRRYQSCAGNHRNTANQMIGKYVKKHTGLNVIGKCSHPKSNLISSYTLLGR